MSRARQDFLRPAARIPRTHARSVMHYRDAKRSTSTRRGVTLPFFHRRATVAFGLPGTQHLFGGSARTEHTLVRTIGGLNERAYVRYVSRRGAFPKRPRGLLITRSAKNRPTKRFCSARRRRRRL